MKSLTPPDKDQIEVVLLGPGYGECVMIHLGNHKWIIIDSCIHSETKKPAAIEYFESIGLEPGECIEYVFVSHWHDDHIKGISEILKLCPNANFCSSSALTKEEFLATVISYEDKTAKIHGSGVDEIRNSLRHIYEHGKNVVRAGQDRRIFTHDGKYFSHGKDIEAWSLSPSDEQLDMFYTELTKLMPNVHETKRRMIAHTPNHIAVVLQIIIGEESILLGSDLENSKSNNCGWSAIINSTGKPKKKSKIFKIPHHGSSNAHHDNVWQHMLENNPYSVVTPFNRGVKLPKADDINRINSLTDNAYTTIKKISAASSIKRDHSVDKTIKETVGKLKTINNKLGWLVIRNNKNNNFNEWIVTLSELSSHLSETS